MDLPGATDLYLMAMDAIYALEVRAHPGLSTLVGATGLQIPLCLDTASEFSERCTWCKCTLLLKSSCWLLDGHVHSPHEIIALQRLLPVLFR